MSVPMKRHTSSAVRRRRSHHAIKKLVLSKCPQCGKAILPHKACSFCGHYRGRTAVMIKMKNKKGKK